MRKRRMKSRSETLKSQISEEEEEYRKGDETRCKVANGFFACYLLTSLCPRFKGHTYIGFTVNPRRRIRQHNGEIRCGAGRTKRRRPWEMVLCIYGFPTNVSALQFEWAWQHPTESIAVRQAAATFKSFSGVANKIKLGYMMLNLPAWQKLNITVNFFTTKYTKHAAGCPSLPEHMKFQVCPMDELPCYVKRDDSMFEDEDDCDDDEEYYGARNDADGAVEAKKSKIHGSPMDDELPCYAKRDDSLLEEEDGCDDDERYYEARNGASGAVKAKRAKIQSCSMDELPCYIEIDESLYKGGYGDHCQDGCYDEEDSGGTSETVRETHTDSTAHFQVDNSHVNEEIFHEHNGWFDDYGKTQLRDSSSPGMGKGATEDGNMAGLIEESIADLDWPKGMLVASKLASANDQQPIRGSTISTEVEVIDLLTPPRECRIRSWDRKSRRTSTVCLEIIDLT